MIKFRPAVFWLPLLLSLLTVSKGTIAQDREQTKSDIVFKMLDYDARFRMIFAYTDAESRTYLANTAKSQYLEFKQLLEPNMAFFLGNEKDKLKETVKLTDKILLNDEVFNTLNTPNYRNESKPEKGEKLEDRWIDIHKAILYVLIKDMVVRANFKIYTRFSEFAVAADVSKNGPAASHHYADSLLKTAPGELMPYYYALQDGNNEESRVAIKTLIDNYKTRTGDLYAQTLALYERPNTLLVSPEGQKDDLQLKSKYASSKIWQDALIREMPETEKFAIMTVPNDRPDLHNSIYIFGKYMRAKKGETPDITFRIVSPGLTGVDFGRIRKVPVGDNRYGYVSTITYYCPIKIEVVNKAGEIEKTLIVIDEGREFRQEFHENYVRPNPNFTGVIPFRNDTLYYEALDKFRSSTINRLYNERFSEMTGAMSQWLNDAYGYYKVPNNFYYLYDVKNPENGFQEIKALVDSTDYAIEHLETQETSLANKAVLARMLEKYQEILQRPGVSQNVKNLCARNSVTCALLSDQVTRALYLLERCKAINPKDSYVRPFNLSSFVFRTLFDDKNQKVVKLPPRSELWKY